MAHSGYEFRKAFQPDHVMIAELVNRGYGAKPGDGSWTSEGHLLSGERTNAHQISEMMALENSHFEVAFRDGAIEGCVYLRRDADHTCYLGMLTVDPGRQAKGLGKMLIERAESLAKDWGCTLVKMRVINVREELFGFYGRRGYRPSGRREAFISQAPKARAPLASNNVSLEFVELVKEIL